MSLDALKERLPDYARDLKINLGVITGASSLTPRQHWGTAVAAALATRQREVIAAITAAAAPSPNPTDIGSESSSIRDIAAD